MRAYWIDLLRFLSGVLVISIHTCVASWVSYGQIPTFDWQIINIFMSISMSWGVPIFVMISGYVILGRDIDTRKFYVSKAKRLIPALLFWSIFYSLFNYFFFDNSLKDLMWELTIGLFLSGKTYYHLWYLSMFIWLIAVTPFINKWIKAEKITLADLKIVFIICCCYMLFNSLSFVKAAITPSGIEWYNSFALNLVYFIAGYYIGNNSKEINLSNRFLLTTYFILLSIATLLNYVAVREGIIKDNLILGAGSIFSFVLPAIVFLVFSRYKANVASTPAMKLLSELALGMYLVHPFVLYFIQKYTNILISNLIIDIIVTITLTTLTSIIAIILLRKMHFGRLIT